MADLRRRVDELRAVAMEHMPGKVDEIQEQFARLMCDGCGKVLAFDLDAVDAPGWQLGPPDYCPDCA